MMICEQVQGLRQRVISSHVAAGAAPYGGGAALNWERRAILYDCPLIVTRDVCENRTYVRVCV